AVEAILDVAEEYSFENIGDNPEGKLMNAILAALTDGNESSNPIPAAVVLPVFYKRYEAEPDKYEQLLANVVRDLRTTDKSVLNQVRSLCKNESALVRGAAFNMLLAQNPTSETIRLALAERDSGIVIRTINVHIDGFHQRDGWLRVSLARYEPEFIPL